MKAISDVSTGEVAAGKSNVVLKSSGIGSCIVVAALDPHSKIGGMAHIMLPRKAPEREKEKNKYAINAMTEMISKMEGMGAKKNLIETCIAGGANVLKEENDTICKANIEFVLKYLKKINIPLQGQNTGGTERKSITLDIDTRTFLSSTAGDPEKPIYKNNSSINF